MGEAPVYINSDPWIWGLCLGLVALWGVFTVWMLRKRRPAEIDTADIIVVYASQTGQAADIAEQTRLRFEGAGEPCALLEADRLTPEVLERARDLFFVVSTTGEGAAPDNGSRFERTMLTQTFDMSEQAVAILALGDRRYSEFCAFGRRIEDWARRGNAQVLFPPVQVDDLAEADLAVWDRYLSGMGYHAQDDEAGLKATMPWRIASREQVAGPGRNRAGDLVSDGLYRITLRPDGGGMPGWEVGDLFELHTPDGHVRDYSIANRPGRDEVLLFVRRVVDNGIVGCGSGYLTGAEIDSTVVTGRLRSHRTFHAPTGDGPLLAIGAGSGWAGLRPHLLHAMALGQPCRLIFGERESEAQAPLLAEMHQWHGEGRLERLDLALSRAGGQGALYVQHVLAQSRAEIAEFLGSSGRIVLCGRLAMGEQSMAALAGILGSSWLDQAREEGRLRRDLY